MALKYGFYHVELGQLLREEAQRSTQRGRQIRDIMQKGLLVPTVRVHRSSWGHSWLDGVPRKPGSAGPVTALQP
jgi:adenylate kinase family enzyme